MRLAAVLAVMLTASPAVADRTRFALDFDVGGGGITGEAFDGSTPYVRTGLGAQRGAIAVLVHFETFGLDTADPMLDSEHLTGVGAGAALRVELTPRGPWMVFAQVGVTRRAMLGDSVQRTCTTSLACDHGYYQEDVDYTDTAPWLALDAGYHSGHHLVGAELGLGDFTIDRPGALPDAHGAMIWLAFHVSLGR